MSNQMHRWLVTVNDAPLRCGFCAEKIMGSGTGPLGVLIEAVSRHTETCPSGLAN